MSDIFADNTYPQIDRDLFFTLIDANMSNGESTNYVLLGDDLEELTEELNPDIEKRTNILGKQSVVHKGYEPETDVDPYYARKGDPLYATIENIAKNRLKGSACKTTKVETLFNEDGTCAWATQEDVMIVPKSKGGDTSGYAIPFTIYSLGNLKHGTFNASTKQFTEANP